MLAGTDAPGNVYYSGLMGRWNTGIVVVGKIGDGNTLTRGTRIRIPVRPCNNQYIPAKKAADDTMWYDLRCNVRLYGYVCDKSNATSPSRSSENNAVNALAHICGRKGREYLHLRCIFVGDVTDNYARAICVIYNCQGVNVNRWMIENGYGTLGIDYSL
jgi:hypothetical protein